jgi:tRNA threonylcarbamoyladenosine biosynthesis protein TsaB
LEKTIILCIDTGGDVCSVAIYKGMQIKELEEKPGREHAKNLSLLIKEVLDKSKIKYIQIDAIAINKGPGSYTGLRIAASTVKGICYVTGKPLIAIDSLLSLASLCDRADKDAIYCPMIDARRNEVYCALFDADLNRLSDIQALKVGQDSFSHLYPERKIIFFGSGADKCKTLIKRSNIDFIDLQSSARGLIKPAIDAWEQKNFEDIAYFEPLYLKDFVAIKADNKFF